MPISGNNNFSSPLGQNTFNSESSSDDESLNIDDLIKKIDSKIAELEEEEKKDNEAKDNEEVASSKKLVEDIMKDNITKEEDNNIHSSDVIMSPNKIDFSSFELPEEKKSDNKEIKSDIMDDFLEDLSMDEIEDEPITNNVNSESILNIENKVEEKAPDTSGSDLYVNKEEVDKIMKENEPEDFFDDFFE